MSVSPRALARSPARYRIKRLGNTREAFDAIFAGLDADNDNEISKAELKAWLNTNRDAATAPHGGGGGGDDDDDYGDDDEFEDDADDAPAAAGGDGHRAGANIQSFDALFGEIAGGGAAAAVAAAAAAAAAA